MSAFLSGIFSCKDAALQVLMFVPLSVCGQLEILPSLRLPRVDQVFQGYPRLLKGFVKLTNFLLRFPKVPKD